MQQQPRDAEKRLHLQGIERPGEAKKKDGM
jgi:hypothetical protein